MKGAITIGIVVCFIIILIFTYVYRSIEEANKVHGWPPHISKCPEYWDVYKGDVNKCHNLNEINRASGYMKDTMIPAYTPDTDLKSFRENAEASRTTAYKYWDGVLLN